MPGSTFHCEVIKSNTDEFGNAVATVKCHGRLASGAASEIKDVVKPMIAAGGRTIIDLGDVDYLDSSGLGALVGLKVSAVKQGFCILEFAQMTPRVMELLRISNLAQFLSSKAS